MFGLESISLAAAAVTVAPVEEIVKVVEMAGTVEDCMFG